jgi:hypothetical protein
MDQQPRRWRFRISALMLLVIVASLVFERLHREREFARTEAALRQLASLERAAAEAERRRAVLAEINAQYDQELIRKVQDAEKGSDKRPPADAPTR